MKNQLKKTNNTNKFNYAIRINIITMPKDLLVDHK